jgi:hypothetical protein
LPHGLAGRGQVGRNERGRRKRRGRLWHVIVDRWRRAVIRSGRRTGVLRLLGILVDDGDGELGEVTPACESRWAKSGPRAWLARREPLRLKRGDRATSEPGRTYRAAACHSQPRRGTATGGYTRRSPAGRRGCTCACATQRREGVERAGTGRPGLTSCQQENEGTRRSDAVVPHRRGGSVAPLESGVTPVERASQCGRGGLERERGVGRTTCTSRLRTRWSAARAC